MGGSIEGTIYAWEASSSDFFTGSFLIADATIDETLELQTDDLAIVSWLLLVKMRSSTMVPCTYLVFRDARRNIHSTTSIKSFIGTRGMVLQYQDLFRMMTKNTGPPELIAILYSWKK